MKKSVAAALAAAAVIGVSSTSFAAIANPFTDVPAGHWAYQSIEKLRVAGVIDGYTDEYGRPNSLFRGDRNITRYEAAQMIARALAKNPTGANKAELDRLVAEFRDELDALGVRVANLEKYADKLQMFGKIEYTYKSHRTDRYGYDQNGNRVKLGGKNRVNMDDMIFRFEPVAHVNDHWTLRARIDAHVDLSRDTSSDYHLERGWAQGDYDNFQIKLGRQPLWTNEDGIVWDTEYSGAEVTFGKFSDGLRATFYGGRLNAGKVGGSIRNMTKWDGRQDANAGRKDWEPGYVGATRNDPTSFWAVNVQYDPGAKGLFGGAGYYSLKDDDLKGVADFNGNKVVYYSNDGDTNKAKIWSVNAGWRLGKGQIWGAYARNTEADIEETSWQVLAKYGDLFGGGNQSTHKGQWAVWAGYKQLGSNVGFEALMHDDAAAGTKGFVAGASWAPMDRIVVLAKYFKGKYITGNGDAERLFGRVEFFF
ncbi:MAG: S-layer homology domain-containing protein [Quinella sp. 2Q5]|nr:S-layer homology domain-containing protein [Quinella sp. 2Q5]